MSTCGLLAALADENPSPSSVPASYGGDMVSFQVSRHFPLSQRSKLSIPMNQSGDGASIVMNDTLEKFEVTWTRIPVISPSAPVPPGRISCQTFSAAIWALISFLRVVVAPENKIQLELSCIQYTTFTLNNCALFKTALWQKKQNCQSKNKTQRHFLGTRSKIYKKFVTENLIRPYKKNTEELNYELIYYTDINRYAT